MRGFTYDFNFFFSQRMDWLVYILMFNVHRTASFLVLICGISCKVFMSIVIPIQLQKVVSIFWLSRS